MGRDLLRTTLEEIRGAEELNLAIEVYGPPINMVRIDENARGNLDCLVVEIERLNLELVKSTRRFHVELVSSLYFLLVAQEGDKVVLGV